MGPELKTPPSGGGGGGPGVCRPSHRKGDNSLGRTVPHYIEGSPWLHRWATGRTARSSSHHWPVRYDHMGGTVHNLHKLHRCEPLARQARAEWGLPVTINGALLVDKLALHRYTTLSPNAKYGDNYPYVKLPSMRFTYTYSWWPQVQVRGRCAKSLILFNFLLSYPLYPL